IPPDSGTTTPASGYSAMKLANSLRSSSVQQYGHCFWNKRVSARLALMNARVDHLLDEVLGLPVEERSALAVALLDSLETADETTISVQWRAEVNRRRAE